MQKLTLLLSLFFFFASAAPVVAEDWTPPSRKRVRPIVVEDGIRNSWIPPSQRPKSATVRPLPRPSLPAVWSPRPQWQGHRARIAPVAPEERAWIDDLLRKFSAQYGVKYSEMHRTMMCESGGNPLAVNRHDPHGGAHGLMQFLRPTFYKYAPLAGIKKPDINNPAHQVQTAAFMFAIGEKSQWTCARKLGFR